MTTEAIAQIKKMFGAAGFVQDLGIELGYVGEDRVETTLDVKPRHLQQHGVVHAGVLATIADHTAGGAGSLHLSSVQSVVSIEFKINMLRPATGTRLRCVGTPLKPGRTISVAESEVYSQRTLDDGTQEEKLVAKATVTLAVTDRILGG